VPASFDVLRVLKESIEQLPNTVKTVNFRADGAGYQKDLIRFCDSGESRFGVIHYAVSAEVSPGLKEAARSIAEENWHELYNTDSYGNRIYKNQQWADIPYVPNWVAHKKSNPDVRFIAIREGLHDEKRTEDSHQFPFPTCIMNGTHYKLFAIASNQYDRPGEVLVNWHRQRCGKAEDLHKEEKKDLACQPIPSKYFGFNAAWWLIMVLAFNLEKIIQSFLPEQFQHFHMIRLRRALINISGNIVFHSRRLRIKVNQNCAAICRILIVLRQNILIAGAPPP